MLIIRSCPAKVDLRDVGEKSDVLWSTACGETCGGRYSDWTGYVRMVMRYDVLSLAEEVTKAPMMARETSRFWTYTVSQESSVR